MTNSHAVAKKLLKNIPEVMTLKSLKMLSEKFSEEELAEKEFYAQCLLQESRKKAVRDMVLNENVRLDGRSPSEIRKIWCEIDYLPRPSWFCFVY